MLKKGEPKKKFLKKCFKKCHSKKVPILGAQKSAEKGRPTAKGITKVLLKVPTQKVPILRAQILMLTIADEGGGGSENPKNWLT